MNEPFDPHRHNAVFQVPDASKPPGVVAHILKVSILYPLGFKFEVRRPAITCNCDKVINLGCMDILVLHCLRGQLELVFFFSEILIHMLVGHFSVRSCDYRLN